MIFKIYIFTPFNLTGIKTKTCKTIKLKMCYFCSDAGSNFAMQPIKIIKTCNAENFNMQV